MLTALTLGLALGTLGAPVAPPAPTWWGLQSTQSGPQKAPKTTGHQPIVKVGSVYYPDSTLRVYWNDGIKEVEVSLKSPPLGVEFTVTMTGTGLYFSPSSFVLKDDGKRKVTVDFNSSCFTDLNASSARSGYQTLVAQVPVSVTVLGGGNR